MFILRQEHLDAFQRVSRESFEDRMMPHLRERYAAECEKLGDAGVRERIQDGIDRAAKYGIKGEAEVSAYIRYMFGLGPDFDTAWKTSWAGEILRDTDLTPADKIAKIKVAAKEKKRKTKP